MAALAEGPLVIEGIEALCVRLSLLIPVKEQPLNSWALRHLQVNFGLNGAVIRPVFRCVDVTLRDQRRQFF